MIITHQREKLVNAIIFFAKNTNLCGKTKLLKLLYYLDFWHFRETGESVTGLDYSAWKFGPVPTSLYNELSEKMKSDLENAVKVVTKNQFQQIIPKKNFNLTYFTRREKRLLNKVAEIFKTTKAEDMIESTHMKNMPWYKTLKEKGEYQHIDYFLSIDDSPDSISAEDALDRVTERKEMYDNFGKI
jgi:uncharacterized phage-associated protein